MPEAITRDQLKRLQTLWGKFARHEMLPTTREERLRWANDQLNYPDPADRLTSFNQLTLAEASSLINALQSALGIKETSPAAGHRLYRSRIKDRVRAHAAGTEGRRGSKTHTMAAAEDLEMIDHQLTAMGWTRAQLDALLASPSSPLGRKSNPTIRTVGEVNRILYALKGITRRALGSTPQPNAKESA